MPNPKVLSLSRVTSRRGLRGMGSSSIQWKTILGDLAYDALIRCRASGLAPQRCCTKAQQPLRSKPYSPDKGRKNVYIERITTQHLQLVYYGFRLFVASFSKIKSFDALVNICSWRNKRFRCISQNGQLARQFVLRMVLRNISFQQILPTDVQPYFPILFLLSLLSVVERCYQREHVICLILCVYLANDIIAQQPFEKFTLFHSFALLLWEFSYTSEVNIFLNFSERRTHHII